MFHWGTEQKASLNSLRGQLRQPAVPSWSTDPYPQQLRVTQLSTTETAWLLVRVTAEGHSAGGKTRLCE